MKLEGMFPIYDPSNQYKRNQWNHKWISTYLDAIQWLVPERSVGITSQERNQILHWVDFQFGASLQGPIL